MDDQGPAQQVFPVVIRIVCTRVGPRAGPWSRFAYAFLTVESMVVGKLIVYVPMIPSPLSG